MRRFAASHGIAAMLGLLQRLQLETLQDQGVARAARRLAVDPDLALPLPGFIALTTNAATLALLGRVGAAAAAVAVLAARADGEDEQPIRLSFAEEPDRGNGLAALAPHPGGTDVAAERDLSALRVLLSEP